MATGNHYEAPYDLVFVGYSAGGDSYGSREDAAKGFIEAWSKYIAEGSTIVVIADNPRNTPEVLECLEKN